MIHQHMVGVEECFLVPGFAEWLERQAPEALRGEVGEIWNLFRLTSQGRNPRRLTPRFGGIRHG
ncbi:MAG: hypothetical protein WA705_19980 [Candidatus Ozemobacteraceae bacterium]